MKSKLLNYSDELEKHFNSSEKLSTVQDIISYLRVHNIRMEFCTVTKLIGLETDYDFNTGDITFIKKKISKCLIGKYYIIIIDECSMLPLKHIYYIVNEIKNAYGKVIFVGDPAQINPVNENDSRISVSYTHLTLPTNREV